MGKKSLPERRPDVEVWAGGGVVWRTVGDVVELLLVHRDHREDWSFPKGKLDPGETLIECAVREVEEETGLRCETGERLAIVEYRDGRGRDKAVVYWLMVVVGGRFEPNDEVDACGWFDLASARTVLTYDRDRDLVDEVESRIASSTIAP
ncbi:MAG: NUDIX hydrolase [Actinomycetota bacterium]